jgi:hypothetical protein
LLDVQVLDEHYANLPAAELKPSPKRKPTTSPAPIGVRLRAGHHESQSDSRLGW